MLFQGLGVAMVTPFDDKGINYDTTERLIEFWVNNGVSALFPLGTTGEASTISDKEKESYLKFIIEKVKGRIPIIAGTGSNSTEIAIKNTIKAEELGADGALIVTPYYNKCTQDGIFAHYEAISKATNIHIIAYNVPGRTSVNILPRTAQRLCEIKNIVGIKEASGNMEQIMETIRLTNGRLDVYSGDDALTATTMMMGGVGVISVVGNVAPWHTKRLTNLCIENDYTSAAELQLKLLPLINTLFSEVNPIPVKAALNLLGFEVGIPRLPLTPAKNETVNALYNNLIELNLI